MKLNKKQLAALKELELFIRHNGVKCYVLERLKRFKETLGIKKGMKLIKSIRLTTFKRKVIIKT